MTMLKESGGGRLPAGLRGPRAPNASDTNTASDGTTHATDACWTSSTGPATRMVASVMVTMASRATSAELDDAAGAVEAKDQETRAGHEAAI